MGQQIPAHLNRRGGTGRVYWFLESKKAIDGTTNTSPFKQKGWDWKGGELCRKEEVTGAEAEGCQQVGTGAVPCASVRLEALGL